MPQARSLFLIIQVILAEQFHGVEFERYQVPISFTACHIHAIIEVDMAELISAFTKHKDILDRDGHMAMNEDTPLYLFRLWIKIPQPEHTVFIRHRVG